MNSFLRPRCCSACEHEEGRTIVVGPAGAAALALVDVAGHAGLRRQGPAKALRCARLPLCSLQHIMTMLYPKHIFKAGLTRWLAV